MNQRDGRVQRHLRRLLRDFERHLGVVRPVAVKLRLPDQLAQRSDLADGIAIMRL